MAKTKDNCEVRPGDTVWCWADKLQEYKSHVVKSISNGMKIEYTEPCPDEGYIGARMDVVYKNKPESPPEEDDSPWR